MRIKHSAICKNCGMKFIYHPEDQEWKHIFCSKECRTEYELYEQNISQMKSDTFSEAISQKMEI